MRPPRILIVAAFCITFAFILVTSSQSSSADPKIPGSNSEQRAGIGSLLSFQTPFSLFPPNAIISLTDDNTTSFLARPAAFGPLLPSKGLSGQLWIGSGFGDDSLRQGTMSAGAEGELGCSDVPGWAGGLGKAGIEGGGSSQAANTGKSQNQRRAGGGSITNDRTAAPDQRRASDSLDIKRPSVDDGTDDYLHHPLPGSPFAPPPKSGQGAQEGKSEGKNSNHADIQSIQEGAEIAGKVVILSRGGCGFLEKVKWVQRRGGIALIVGDDTRGGPLIQMYARGDTSNVTIPSVFTSHTTAHLLSSLIPPGSFIEDTIDENGKVSLKVQQSNNPTKKGGQAKDSQPTFTPTSAVPKASPPPKQTTKSNKKNPTTQETKPSSAEEKKKSWLKSIFGKPQSGSPGSESSRPPSSGRLDWVLVDDWDYGEGKKNSNQKNKNTKQSKSSSKDNANSKSSQNDDFVIGVQDWRDPDLVGSSKDTSKDTDRKDKNVGKTTTTTSSVTSPKQTPPSGKKQAGDSLEGGSITPGSGEYGSGATTSQSKSKPSKGDTDKQPSENSATSSLLSKIFGDDDEDEVDVQSSGPKTGVAMTNHIIPDEIFGSENDHDGLWVTLTPTSGASPFFDTLLVLVVSPLVTLTVVYALLLLRSRIRRRRWRAPKSVVERLPVRTFQTRVSSTSSSPRLPSSPTTSNPTTPLLQGTPSRPRPRSRTTSGTPAELADSPSDPRRVPSRPSRGPEHEKGASVTSQWSKFMGKQVKCVVCLEEYIDGVSRVMSLPCGHEFHEACITPWLTTRRRTCPICKGDVVRSLARGSPSGSPSNPRYDAYHDESDSSSVDVQIQAAETVNESPTSAMPIPSDLESGTSGPTRSRRGVRRGTNWRSLLATSLGGSSGNNEQGANDRSR